MKKQIETNNVPVEKLEEFNRTLKNSNLSVEVQVTFITELSSAYSEVEQLRSKVNTLEILNFAYKGNLVRDFDQLDEEIYEDYHTLWRILQDLSTGRITEKVAIKLFKAVK